MEAEVNLCADPGRADGPDSSGAKHGTEVPASLAEGPSPRPGSADLGSRSPEVASTGQSLLNKQGSEDTPAATAEKGGHRVDVVSERHRTATVVASDQPGDIESGKYLPPHSGEDTMTSTDDCCPSSESSEGKLPRYSPDNLLGDKDGPGPSVLGKNATEMTGCASDEVPVGKATAFDHSSGSSGPSPYVEGTDVGGADEIEGQSGKGLSGIVGATVRIQAAARGHLTRKEALKAHRHSKILLPRQDLVKRLREFPDSRTTKAYSWCYFVFVLIFLSACCLQRLPNETYVGLGSLRDRAIRSSAMPVYSVQSVNDLWTFVDDFIDGFEFQTLPSSGNVTYAFYDPDTFVATDTLRIMARRRENVACSSLYSTDGVWPSFAFDNCKDVSSFNTADYGGTTDTSWSHIDLIKAYLNETAYNPQSSTIDQYIGSAATLCPVFKHAPQSLTDFTFVDKRGGYQIPLYLTGYENLSSSKLKDVTAMLHRCKFIDRLVYSVSVEIYGMRAFPVPMTTIFIIYFDWGVDDKLYIHEETTAITTVRSSRAAAAMAFYILSTICSCFGVVVVLLDLAFNMSLDCSVSYLVTYLQDGHNVMGVVAYASVFASCVVYFIYNETTHTMVHTTDIGNGAFFDNFRSVVLMDYLYRHFIAAAIFFMFMRMLGYGRHRGMISMVWKVIHVVTVQTLHFLIAFTFVLLSFSLSAWFLWGDMIQEYYTLTECMQTLTLQLAGSFDYSHTKNRGFVSSFIFFVAFFIVVSALALNFFVAIVLEGYAAVASQQNVDLPFWKEIWGDIVNLRVIFQDLLTTTNFVSASHLAFLLNYDRIGRHHGKAKEISMLRLHRLAGGHLTPEAVEAIVGLMKDIGIDQEDWESARAGPYKRLDMGYIETFYGTRAKRMLDRTPIFLRRYVLLGIHFKSSCRERIRYQRECKARRKLMCRTTKAIRVSADPRAFSAKVEPEIEGK